MPASLTAGAGRLLSGELAQQLGDGLLFEGDPVLLRGRADVRTWALAVRHEERRDHRFRGCPKNRQRGRGGLVS